MNLTDNHAWLCERIVNDSPVGIVFADEQGIIRLWNAGAETMFGHTAAEAIGQSLDIIVPERHRARHWEGWHKVMQTGVTKYGRDVLAVPAIRKDGQRVSIEFTVTLVQTEGGSVLGAAAVIQDVSARWERDKAMQARVAALEKQVAELEKGVPAAKAQTKGS
jgi:PAS domain S-box-containing protein